MLCFLINFLIITGGLGLFFVSLFALLWIDDYYDNSFPWITAFVMICLVAAVTSTSSGCIWK